MQAELDEAEHLIALHGTGAIGALVRRISDAVRMCDDQAVYNLDHILQLVEARIEGPWRRPSAGTPALESSSMKASERG